jgi:hypothetical protein
MSTITFDTQEAVAELRAVGVSQEHAEAFIRAIVKAHAELVTKRDIDDLRRDMEARFTQLESRLIQLEQRLIIKLGGLMALSIGTVAALVKLL